jgi:PPOX class probable F420-dependent enzyme
MPIALPASARELLQSDALAHLVTINRDGSPQVTCVWVGLDDEEIVAAHLNPRQRKLENLRRDARVVLSMEGHGRNPVGMQDYLVVRGRARLQEGGAPELLQELARVYVAPDARFPPMADPPPGVICRISIEHVSGHGPWAQN